MSGHKEVSPVSREVVSEVINLVNATDEKFTTSNFVRKIDISRRQIQRTLNDLEAVGYLTWEREGRYLYWYKIRHMSDVERQAFLENYHAVIKTGDYVGFLKENFGKWSHWQNQRENRIEADGYKCLNCGMSRNAHHQTFDQDLHIHHRTPRSEFDMSDEYEVAHEIENLATLCKRCHTVIENNPHKYPEYHSTRDSQDHQITTTAIDW